MSQEIVYTSAPQGLKPGSRGFCTVASTPGMAKNLAERLESLSGYRHVYEAHSSQAAMNPVNYSHLVLKVGGRTYHVLSRVADAGLDYTQRSNKLAHHVALEPKELSPGGPAWALASEGFCLTHWEGAPRHLPTGRSVPATSRPMGPCASWEALTGDAGWGGVLAATALKPGGPPQNVIYPPGTDVLPLVVESLSLLPPERRWEVSFSTYFTKLPPGVNCQWRFLLEGTPEATALRRNPHAQLIDLCQRGQPAPATPLTAPARTGQLPPAAPPQPATTPAPQPQQPDTYFEEDDYGDAAAEVPETTAAATSTQRPPTIGDRNKTSAAPPQLEGLFEAGRSKSLKKVLIPLSIAALLLVATLVVHFIRNGRAGSADPEDRRVAQHSDRDAKENTKRPESSDATAANGSPNQSAKAHNTSDSATEDTEALADTSTSTHDPEHRDPAPSDPEQEVTSTEPPNGNTETTLPKKEIEPAPKQPETFLAASPDLEWDLTSEKIADGDSLLVMPGCRVRVTLPNGMKLEVRGGSHVAFPRLGDAEGEEPTVDLRFGRMIVHGEKKQSIRVSSQTVEQKGDRFNFSAVDQITAEVIPDNFAPGMLKLQLHSRQRKTRKLATQESGLPDWTKSTGLLQIADFPSIAALVKGANGQKRPLDRVQAALESGLTNIASKSTSDTSVVATTWRVTLSKNPYATLLLPFWYAQLNREVAIPDWQTRLKVMRYVMADNSVAMETKATLSDFVKLSGQGEHVLEILRFTQQDISQLAEVSDLSQSSDPGVQELRKLLKYVKIRQEDSDVLSRAAALWALRMVLQTKAKVGIPSSLEQTLTTNPFVGSKEWRRQSKAWLKWERETLPSLPSKK